MGLFKRRRHYDYDYHPEAVAPVRRFSGSVIRKLIACAFLVALVWLLYWVVTASPLSAQVAQTVGPFWESAVAMVNDPLGIDYGEWIIGAAIIIIPHIGILCFFFDESLR